MCWSAGQWFRRITHTFLSCVLKLCHIEHGTRCKKTEESAWAWFSIACKGSWILTHLHAYPHFGNGGLLCILKLPLSLAKVLPSGNQTVQWKIHKNHRETSAANWFGDFSARSHPGPSMLLFPLGLVSSRAAGDKCPEDALRQLVWATSGDGVCT